MKMVIIDDMNMDVVYMVEFQSAIHDTKITQSWSDDEQTKSRNEGFV